MWLNRTHRWTKCCFLALSSCWFLADPGHPFSSVSLGPGTFPTNSMDSFTPTERQTQLWETDSAVGQQGQLGSYVGREGGGSREAEVIEEEAWEVLTSLTRQVGKVHVSLPRHSGAACPWAGAV